MGIINATDDSFYAPSRVLSEDGKPDEFTLRNTIRSMLLSGADILDIGACSTRPGSIAVGADTEWQRLKVILPIVQEEAPVTPISIDTYNASVIEKAYDLIGPVIVNDISSGVLDRNMLPLAGRLGLPYIAMHMRGTPETMSFHTDYRNGVVEDVKNYFLKFAQKASDNGITNWYLDPGFGFAKTLTQNYTLLKNLSELTSLLRPIVVGVSRKSMIYSLLGQNPEDSLPPTQALHMAALERGASILRVHDVSAARHTLVLYKKLAES